MASEHSGRPPDSEAVHAVPVSKRHIGDLLLSERFLAVFVCLIIAGIAVHIGIKWYVSTPGPEILPIGFFFLVSFLPLSLFCPAIPFGLYLIVRGFWEAVVLKDIRRMTSLMGAGFLCVFLPCLAGYGESLEHRLLARHLNDISAPIRRAVAAYEVDTGAPPPTLEHLVPEYLPSVPKSRIRGFDNLRYTTEIEPTRRKYTAAQWQLKLDDWSLTSSGPFYWPTETYPASMSGTVIVVGTWAYEVY